MICMQIDTLLLTTVEKLLLFHCLQKMYLFEKKRQEVDAKAEIEKESSEKKSSSEKV